MYTAKIIGIIIIAISMFVCFKCGQKGSRVCLINDLLGMSCWVLSMFPTIGFYFISSGRLAISAIIGLITATLMFLSGYWYEEKRFYEKNTIDE